MPIFGRRQLQKMFTDVQHFLSDEKAADLLHRLESEDPDQCLPAEYELALTWAMSKVTSLEVDRPLGNRRPDIFVSNLIGETAAFLDVAAVSDGSLAGTKLMRRAANILNATARKIRRDSSGHLYYTFSENSGYESMDRQRRRPRQYFRRRCITQAFVITDEIKSALRQWLSQPSPQRSLRVTNQHIDVFISWKESVHPQFNTFCTLPPIAYDIRNNPIYKKLREKADQLKHVRDGELRGVLLGDAGCEAFQNVETAPGFHSYSASDIISKAIVDTKLDFVAVFVPKRSRQGVEWRSRGPLLWHMRVFRRNPSAEFTFKKLSAVVAELPKPMFDASNARSLLEQKAFNPQGRGWYLGASFTDRRDGTLSAKISARAFQEFLAGRIDEKQLRRRISGDIFEKALSDGQTIKAIRLSAAEAQDDDDYIEIEFEDDPAARPLRKVI